MNYFFLVVTFLASFGQICAQSRTIDSLVCQIQTAKEEELFDLYLNITNQYYVNYDPKAMKWIDMILKLKGIDSTQLALAYGVKASIFCHHDDYVNAVIFADSALAIAIKEELLFEQARAYNCIGISNMYSGDYSSAAHSLFQSLRLRDKLKDPSINVAYNNIGVLNYKLRNYTKALSYFMMGLRDNTDIDVALLMNIGTAYYQIHEFEKGDEFITRGLKFISNDTTQRRFLTDANFAIGLKELLKGNYRSSKGYFLRSMEYSQKFSNPRFHSENLVHLSKVFLGLNQYDSALHVLRQGLVVAKKQGFEEIELDILRQYMTVYKKLDRTDSIVIYQQLYLEQKNSLYGTALCRDLAIVNVEELDRQFLLQKQFQKQQMIAKKTSLDLQEDFIILLGIVFLFILAIVFLIFHSIRVNQRLQSLLSRKVKARTHGTDLVPSSARSDNCQSQNALETQLQVFHSLNERIRSSKACARLFLSRADK